MPAVSALSTVDHLRHRLLVQCPPERAGTVAPIAALYHSGLVLTGPKPRATVRYLRRLGYQGPVLCDANRYTGRARVPASAGLTPAWVTQQHELGLVALTDSGHLAAGDWAGLHRLLADAARLPQPLIVTLPLAIGWFAERAWLNRIVATLNESGLPAAIVVDGGSSADRQVTGGLVRLLTAHVPIVVLRSDIAGLGALCHGAHAAALGVSSGLFVPALLGHHRPAVLARIVERTTGLARLWPCGCLECRGGIPAHLTRDGIYRHSLHAQLALGDELRHDVSVWRERCARALAVHRRVEAVMPSWPSPDALRWWYELAPPNVPRQSTGLKAPWLA